MSVLSSGMGSAPVRRRMGPMAAGDRVGDRYRLTQRIARGGMADVWCATDEMLGRTVAVKLLKRDPEGDLDFGARFRAEARAMAALRHPGVAAVYDYGDEDARAAYIVMTYVSGQSLRARIRAAGRLDHVETMSVVSQTAHALQAAHEAGIVHRDVKPGNLLIDPDGKVVLVDFGVARLPDTAHDTGEMRVGTALYMAPEQVSHNAATAATDIYALGAVAYHCLAGRPPFLGDNPLAVALRRLNEDPPPLPDDVPELARQLVYTAMARSPRARFASAIAMAHAADLAAAPPRRAAPGIDLLTGFAPERVVIDVDDERREVIHLTVPVQPEEQPERWRPVVATGMAAAAAVLVALVMADVGGGGPASSVAWQLDPPVAAAPPAAGVNVTDLGREPVVPPADDPTRRPGGGPGRAPWSPVTGVGGGVPATGVGNPVPVGNGGPVIDPPVPTTQPTPPAPQPTPPAPAPEPTPPAPEPTPPAPEPTPPAPEPTPPAPEPTPPAPEPTPPAPEPTGQPGGGGGSGNEPTEPPTSGESGSDPSGSEPSGSEQSGSGQSGSGQPAADTAGTPADTTQTTTV